MNISVVDTVFKAYAAYNFSLQQLYLFSLNYTCYNFKIDFALNQYNI